MIVYKAASRIRLLRVYIERIKAMLGACHEPSSCPFCPVRHAKKEAAGLHSPDFFLPLRSNPVEPSCLCLPLGAVQPKPERAFPLPLYVAHFGECRGGSSSVGRALASQAKGRGFEPRLPLTQPQQTPHIESWQQSYWPLCLSASFL